MSRKEKRSKGRRVSVWNWMGTLLLCSIPGVNIITLILSIILAKTSAKRNFAIAGLILVVLLLALCFAALLIFPEPIKELADKLRGTTGFSLN